MQDPEVAALAASFKDHKEHEDKWQDAIASEIHEMKENNDREFREIKAMLAPMVQQIQENTLFLYGVGPEKTNGLRGDMKGMKAWRESIDAFKWKFAGIVIAVMILVKATELYLTSTGIFHPKQDTSSQYESQTKSGTK